MDFNEKVYDMKVKQNASDSVGGKLGIKEIGRPITELTFCKLAQRNMCEGRFLKTNEPFAEYLYSMPVSVLGAISRLFIFVFKQFA